MCRLSLLIGLLSAIGTNTQTVGSRGCTTSVCVFANPYLRFGTGSENSVNTQGLFVQPWYFSETARTWYKLTFSNYPLDTAIGTGSGTSHWSGTNVYDIYTLPNEAPVTDYSNFIVNYTDTSKTIGYGQIIANRTLTIGSTSFIFQNIFSLGQNDKFVKIVTRIINLSPYTLQNLIIWTGTRDDYVGTTDVNSKTRGNLNTGSFVPITAIGQSSRAIMISNTNEGVLFYSETPGVMTSFALCCAFSNVYNTNPNTLAIATTTPTDGSYAAILPVGNVYSGQEASITWYYAAGTISSLSSVAQSVAAAQVADAGVPVASPVYSFIPSVQSSFSVSPSWHGSSTPFYSYSASNSSVYSPSAGSSSTATRTSVYSPSAGSSFAATRTSVYTPSAGSSYSASNSSVYTPSAEASSTATETMTSTSTASVTPTASTTSSFPLKFVFLPPVNYTDHTSNIFISTESQATATALYALISVNIVIALSCACCSCCALCLVRKLYHDKNKKGSHMVIRHQAF